MSWLGEALVAGGAVNRGMAERDQFDTQQALQKQSLEAGALSLDMNKRANMLQQRDVDLDTAIQEGYQSWMETPADKRGTRPSMFLHLADTVASKPGGWRAAEQFRQAHKAAVDEGFVELAKAGLSNATPEEMERLYNSVGRQRVQPGSVKRDPKTGVYTAVMQDGSESTFDPMRWGVTLGLIKPDEYEYKDGMLVNKVRGTVQKVGTGNPKDYIMAIKNEDGAEVLVDLSNPADVEKFRSGSMFPSLGSKKRGEIDDAVKTTLGANSLNALDPANSQRYLSMRGLSEYLLSKGAINPDTGAPMTPAVAANIAFGLTEGGVRPDAMQQLDRYLPKAEGSTRPAPLLKPDATLDDVRALNPAILDDLRKNASNKRALAQFDETFGVPGLAANLLTQMGAAPKSAGQAILDARPAPSVGDLNRDIQTYLQSTDPRLKGVRMPDKARPDAAATPAPGSVTMPNAAGPTPADGLGGARPPSAAPGAITRPAAPGASATPSAPVGLGEFRPATPRGGRAIPAPSGAASTLPKPAAGSDIENAIRDLPSSMQGPARRELGLDSLAPKREPKPVAESTAPLPSTTRPGATPPAKSEPKPPVNTLRPGQTPLNKPGPKPKPKTTSKPGATPSLSDAPRNDYERAKGVTPPASQEAPKQRSQASREVLSRFQAEDLKWFQDNLKNLDPKVRQFYLDQINQKLQKGAWGGLGRGSRVSEK